MKKRVIFFTVLLLSSITPQAHSFRNICEEAAKALTETHATFNQYFDSYLKNHNADGRSKVRDVFPTADSNAYLVVLDCGNNVLLRTESRSGFLRDL